MELELILISIVDQSVVENRICPCLVGLYEDPNVDFHFFANQALHVVCHFLVEVMIHKAFPGYNY